MHKYFVLALALIAASPIAIHAAQNDSRNHPQAESMTCGDDDPPLTTHDYASLPADTVHPHHLELTRPFETSGKLEIHICRADLRVRALPDAKEIKLTVELNTESARYTVGDYIQTLRIQPDNGVIQLRFPKSAHATVTLTLPMGQSSENEFNLGDGDLDFNAVGSSGKREINVGKGRLQLLLDKDKSYSKMEVNVGMGTLHDHRPGEHDGHFVVAREYKGSGSGSLEINVGMGTLDIRNN